MDAHLSISTMEGQRRFWRCRRELKLYHRPFVPAHAGKVARPEVTASLNPMSMIPGLARTPEPPYYAVIFTSQRTEGDHGYGAMARVMEEMGAKQDGYLGIESVRSADGTGITVSYWRDEAAILAWKRDTEHQKAQRGGRQTWYAVYEVRIARVERAYGFQRGA
jgi:heme-degrading monooxygenase HmoA